MFESILFISLVVLFHQGIMGDDVMHVVGYANESVVLPSNADPSWNLKEIVWSVYENYTQLAFLRSGKTSVNLHPLFQNRLQLNKMTGDLKITNVLSRDASRYQVVILTETKQTKTSYVKLSVQEKLSKPHIELRHSFLDSNNCFIMLSCSSKNINVSLIWQPEPGFNECTCIGPREDTGELVLWTSFKSKRAVTFSCSAVNGKRSNSSSMIVNCTVPEEKEASLLEGPQIRTKERVTSGFIGGLFGCIITCFVSLFYQTYKSTKKDRK